MGNLVPSIAQRCCEKKQSSEIHVLTVQITSSADAGLKAIISGSLTSDGAGLSAIPILLSYSATGGSTWHDISQITTVSDGSYSIVWIPSATGEYVVKATWVGNSTIQGATASTQANLAQALGLNIPFCGVVIGGSAILVIGGLILLNGRKSLP